ncbi:MAG TPA: hypothetical protein ENI23_00505 [bacterium]|nr:hypothetical protein [bacterium]
MNYILNKKEETMIKPRGKWIFFRIQKLSSIGRITLPDGTTLEKEDVIVVAVGPDVKFIKVGEKVIINSRNVICHIDPEVGDKEARGFVEEENVIAIVE